MTIENHVTSFELSKKLFELGVKKPLYMWVIATHEKESEIKPHIQLNHGEEYRKNVLVTDGWSLTTYPAFLTTELTEILPNHFLIDGKTCCFLEINSDDSAPWHVNYENHAVNMRYLRFSDDFLSNAIAKMVVHLIENNIIKVKE